MSDALVYTLRWRGRQLGPLSVAEINRRLDNHEIGMGHEILFRDEWVSLEAFFSAQKKAAAAAKTVPKPATAPAALPASAAAQTPEGKAPPVRIKVSLNPSVPPGAGLGRPRYRLFFALLAVFTGFLGVHNFYARQWMTGLLQLLLSVATVLMGFGIVASWVWAMVEAVLVRRDGRGVEMI